MDITPIHDDGSNDPDVVRVYKHLRAISARVPGIAPLFMQIFEQLEQASDDVLEEAPKFLEFCLSRPEMGLILAKMASLIAHHRPTSGPVGSESGSMGSVIKFR